jgi:hypothetical protein
MSDQKGLNLDRLVIGIDALIEAAKPVLSAEEDGMGVKSTGINCRSGNCSGIIVQEKTKQYLGDHGRFIIGPGGASQMTTVTVLYCPNCGVMYHHLPKDSTPT